MDARSVLEAYSALLSRAAEFAAVKGERDFDFESATLYLSADGQFGISWTETDPWEGTNWRNGIGGPMTMLDMSDDDFAAWRTEQEAQRRAASEAASARYAAERAAQERQQYEALRRKFG